MSFGHAKSDTFSETCRKTSSTYGNTAFNEMFNNAIDHSEGSAISVQVRRTAVTTQMLIADDGYGIFRKIQHEMGLLDETSLDPGTLQG